ncbi:LOW QUALITY PROTEIN: complement C4-like [Sinocyclocheilus rhinocerous]|uniref:LOW QUALITY PROTEIN: complement C4-like n=1 Tax=Sinocyclocheilus rhinocerous TaxID=307959 RepID=UPI0007B8BA8C|nr:PREDICTED: LOW QUALITY PROTEIN: complement C4-like [Sinocyclocheilus rhinocerous]
MICPLFFVVFVFLTVDAQRPTCLIVAPNIIHVGVEETVSVQLHGATKGTSMQLYFQDQIDQIFVSEKKSIILNKDNNYQAVVTVVHRSLYRSTKVQEYVQLAATSNDVFGDKDRNAKKASIFLSTKRGYIFIQTDKPIYNPGENFKYRIFTLDNFMIPIKDEIHVQIINCKGFIVYNHILISDQILEKTIIIPGVEQAGKWKIIASYHKYPESTTSLEFEVKEYVLPTFEVTIEAPQPYHILKSKSFPFNISARYTYGKGVNGIAYIRFGLIDEKGNKIYLPGTEKQIAVEDGTAKTEIRTEDLKTASENNTQGHIEGYYLYIAVSVLEKASGNLEEAESSSVKIVTSPYVVDLSKTKTYFTPGGVFSVLATANYPDGNRVPNLKFTATVSIEGSPEHILKNEGWGNDMGDVAMSFQIPPQAKNLAVTVFAEGRDQEVIHSDKRMTASATKAEEHSYLSLEVEQQVLQPGEALKATLRDITPQSAAKPTFIYFMVWSKGQIVQVGRVPRTEITTVNVNVNVEMVPSFRLVAYYFTDSSPKEKIVADSVWVDVKDVCKGKVETDPLPEIKPATKFEVTVRTDPKTKVALAAVDSAVYILNKNKLSLQKMFEYMNSYDLACSIGGGEDSSAVLQRAGLTFMCNCDMETPKPLEHKCYKFKPEPRVRRAADYVKKYNEVVNSFKDHDRKCCLDGVRPNKMHTSCDERLKRVKESDSCRKAFKQCCEAANERRKREKFEKRKTNLGRVVDDTLDKIVINEDVIYLRKYFPQSWMWTVIQTDSTGIIRHDAVAPDSITTWEIQAVGISPTKGFCIAEPKPLRVFQDFFLSVNLPYSVKRNEQLQVKAVVYNYKQESLKAIVKMDKKEGLCTAGGSEVKEEVVVPGNSAVAVYFTVVPLVIGNIPITVLAYASDTVNDQVEKELRVEGEGEIATIDREYNIDPNLRKLEIDIPVPADEIPGGVDSEINLSLKGGVMGESVNNCLNLEGIDKLIQLPTGCAEQTMVKMSPAIHAMRYLDATKQWISLKAERRDEAQSMIQTGYNTVLTHKKVDGSYGAFLRTPSSIWLTAFIAKELTETRDIINVKDSYIQESMSYLMSKQKSSGAWDDPNRLYDRGMKGGVGQAKDDVPLTAFILISMNHALKLYELGSDTELRVAMDGAKSYLEGQLDALESPYSLAITAYALSLHDQQSAEAQQAHRKLKRIANCDNTKCFWNSKGGRGESAGKADAESVETTAYALLSALSLRDKATAKLTANWLTEQRKYGGGFQSTQDTVVALEALAKYSMQNNDVEDLNLRVEMCLENGQKQDLHLTKYNALTATAVKVRNVGKVSLNVQGTGRGTLAVVQTYRTMKKDESHCDLFHLSVTVKGELEYKIYNKEEMFEDYYNYDVDEDQKDEPMSSIEWFDLRNRRKRQISEEPKRESSVIYTVCVGMKKKNTVGMVMVEISLLSGLIPNAKDLEHNVKGTERYIDHYEVHHNKVFLYFAKITETEECLQFGAEQVVPMGLVQPASAVIYDYYSPEKRCGIFYTAPHKSPMISKLCNGDLCTCAEGGCPRLKVTFSKDMKHNTRSSYACYSPGVDYAYVIKILNSSTDDVFMYYTTLITDVLQTGLLDSGIQKHATRQMILRLSCDELELKNEAHYLIMGQNDAISVLNNDGQHFRYVLNNDMWIERIPEEKNCKATINRSACHLLNEFIKQHPIKRCDI